MGSVLSFILGVIIGVIGAWWFFERRDAKSRAEMEAGWKKKLDHVEAEVRRADAAHDETKEQLRRLQHERVTPPASGGTAPAAAPSAKPPSAPLADQPQGEAERKAQLRRRIDAKLAQLPAGSSARRRLMAERAALDSADGGTAGSLAPGGGAAAKIQPLFARPSEAADDLERIRGIGPVLKQRLNELGITTFAQIAAFSEAEIARIDEVLDFKGRVAREGWVEQAKALRGGG